jgi:cell division protein FtsI (penicillin-binding protein 3)
MYMGIQKSSNVYVAKLVQRIIEQLGDEWYRTALKEMFGFGEKTGVELPGESSGLLPAFGKKHPNGTLEWSRATPYSLAMGHNLLANGLQMMRGYGIFANGGYDVRPTLIRKIVRKHPDGKDEIIVDHTKYDDITKRKQILEPAILEEVIKGMRYTAQPGGSVVRAAIPGYTIAGKTGSSEKVVNGVYSKKITFLPSLGLLLWEIPNLC